MKDLFETLQALQNTPVPNLLVIAGFILLLLAFVGKIGAIIELPRERQKWAAIIGALLLFFGIGLFLVPGTSRQLVLVHACVVHLVSLLPGTRYQVLRSIYQVHVIRARTRR